MTTPFDNWKPSQELSDEILYRDPPVLSRHLEVRDGITRMVEMITFADGSKLALSAQVPLPPMDDMTPTQVTFIKLTGERGQKLDDGSNEAMELARNSSAMRLINKIAKLLDEMPEREKKTCDACCGGKYCIRCYGQGCPECKGTGVCPDCAGHGQMAA